MTSLSHSFSLSLTLYLPSRTHTQRTANRAAIEAAEMLGTAQWAVAAFPDSEILQQLLPFFDFASRDAFLDAKVRPSRGARAGS
jgi:hypothetical protein